jgi:hypothetical protein
VPVAVGSDLTEVFGGDRAVAGELAGVVAQAEQGEDATGDLHGRALTLPFREFRVGELLGADVDEGVSASLVHGSDLGGGPGQGVEGLRVEPFLRVLVVGLVGVGLFGASMAAAVARSWTPYLSAIALSAAITVAASSALSSAHTRHPVRQRPARHVTVGDRPVTAMLSVIVHPEHFTA